MSKSSSIKYFFFFETDPDKKSVPENELIKDKSKNFSIMFEFTNPLTQQGCTRQLKITKTKGKGYQVLEYIPDYINFCIETGILNEIQLTLGQDKLVSYIIYGFPKSVPFNKKGLSPGIAKFFRRLYYDRFYANGKIKRMQDEGVSIPEEEGDDSVYPRRLFAPDKGTSGKTTLILGSSFSGKTYLLSKELSLVKPFEYDLIILFTASVNSEPLDDLKKRKDILIVEGFDPSIPLFLKTLNNKVGLRFRFLIILDDIIDADSTRRSPLGGMITTYRNSGISTVVLSQHPNIISKTSRGNFHQIVITGMRTSEGNESLTKVFDVLSWAKRRMINDGVTHHIVYPDIYEYLKKLLMENGVVMYIDMRKSKEPSIVKI